MSGSGGCRRWLERSTSTWHEARAGQVRAERRRHVHQHAETLAHRLAAEVRYGSGAERGSNPARPLYFEQGHLPGAINIPHTDVRELAPSLLPDKDTAIVTYCSNTACQNSAVAQAELLAVGYTDVRKYADGKQDWQATGPPLEAEVAGVR